MQPLHSFQTQSKIYSEPDEVSQKLNDLGLQSDMLEKVITKSRVERSEITANFPPTMPGLTAWGFAVAEFRNILCPLGWNKDDTGNYPVIVHPENKLVIAVATGDENTGNPKISPRTKSEKGSKTNRAVDINNNQLVLFPEIDIASITSVVNRQTWILLMHFEGKNVVKYELSLPTHCNGKIDGWGERIILPALDTDLYNSMPISPIVPLQPVIDIPIKRKAA